MRCPNCDNELRERERSGISVDICPVCKGVWLDRGELDKLIERERRVLEDDDDDEKYASPHRGYEASESRRGQYDRERDRVEYAREGHKKKKSGFLSNLTEMLGGGGMDD